MLLPPENFGDISIFFYQFSMDIDLDELISTTAANNVKASTKFQPKAKLKPKPKTQPEPKSKSTPSTQFVEAAATTEELLGNDVNQISGNINDNLQSSFEKSQQENAESYFAVDSLNDFLPESTTETQTVDVSMDGNLETGPTEPEVIIDTSTNLESIAVLDPLTGNEDAIYNNNEHFQIENLSSGSKDAEISPLWGSLSILSPLKTCSGPRVGKFKPKPKAQTCKMEQIANNPDKDVGSIQYGDNIDSIPSQTGFMDNEPCPSFTPDEILGPSSIRVDSVNEEPINLGEISQVDSVNEAGKSSERLRRQSNKTLRLIDEYDDEDNNNNDDYVPENESLIERKETKSKSKKPLNENKKPIRKRKIASDVPDELMEVPKKKFPHRTRGSKRQVDPELLKIPEDELELHMHHVPMKDLIRLREHRERIAKKEASTSGTLAHDVPMEAQNATYYNYRTHMKITPRMKWSKQDTELFYEAIQQFGVDFSMIKECFPGRTREQIRSKYKKEGKQQPSRLKDALITRAKGHSHFEVVIERLKQARAEDSENDDPFTLTGEEDEVAAANINKGGDAMKNVGLQKQVKDMEPDVPVAVESPTKSHDSEDDNSWSQYKSEI